MKCVWKGVLGPDQERALLALVQNLYFIEQTLKYDPINFLDFCTQLRGRFLNESNAKNLPDFCFENLVQQENFAHCYFESFHHSLKENPRIDFVTKMSGCQILAIKFMNDKNRIFISTSNGLMFMLNTHNNTVSKLFVNKTAVVDQVKIIDDKYAICGGIDRQLRIWNLETERQLSKMDSHQYSILFALFHKEFVFTFGYDKTIVKLNFMRKEKVALVDVTKRITAAKKITCSDTSMPFKIVVSFADGEIVLYDLDLKVLFSVQRHTNSEIIKIVQLSPGELLCFYKEGQLTVLNTLTLDEVRQGSIFNLKSEDYLDLILIKSREYFLFTIERHKVEFFNGQNFKRSDSWDYFFEKEITGCDKNREGSKICVWDKGGYLILFNFLKSLDPLTKVKHIPNHRKFDPVICIDVTEKLDSNQIISCSLDRDLRVWDRSTGAFVKKYDLSSFTAENISAIKLGKAEGMLFLGSKDMNVYLIDVQRGKLTVVYEGHWSRVTQIYTIPGKDILVTLSDSNIKIWDLEYDECIKNMNEHSALIIYCSISKLNDQLIVTVSQNLEYKEWNYITGVVVKSFLLNIKSSLLAEKIETQGDLDAEDSKLKTDTDVNINLISCHISDNQVAFLALESNHIVVHNLTLNQAFCVFKSYQNQTVVSLSSIETAQADYLVIVTRTACTLYLLQADGVRRMTGYLLSARKKPLTQSTDSKFAYNFRFYFTSAKIIKAHEKPVKGSDFAEIDAQNDASPMKLFDADDQGIDRTIFEQPDQMVQQREDLEQSEGLRQEIKLDDQNRSARSGPDSLQLSGRFELGNNTKHEQGNFSTHFTHEFFDHVSISHQTPSGREKYLVCLGDSRGQVHMCHLYLP